MREVISVHVGRAGVETGNQCWELFCLEHGIDPDGCMPSSSSSSSSSGGGVSDDAFHSFFEEHGGSSSKFVPRSLFIDTDCTSMDEIRTGTYRRLFQPNNLLSGKEDASNNYGCGKLLGMEMEEMISDRIRRLADNATGLLDFHIYHSVGGGTGSGLMGGTVLKILQRDYGKKTNTSFSIFPSAESSASVIEPYNSLLSSHDLIEKTDLCLTFDNRALYSVAKKYLDIDRPTFRSMNEITSHIISNFTSSRRFDGALNTNIEESFVSHLVPYPRIHFIVPSHAPFESCERTCFPPKTDPTILEMTEQCFEASRTLVKCEDVKEGKFMATSLIYRGDVAPMDINAAIRDIRSKGTLKFVDWAPSNGFRCSVKYQPPTMRPGSDLGKVVRAVSAFSNNTVVRQLFADVTERFDILFAKKAYLHWFVGQGMEEGEVMEARENLAALQMDFTEIAATDDYEEEEEEDEGEESKVVGTSTSPAY